MTDEANENPDKQAPKRTTRAGGRLPWRRDPIVLARLPQVERLHLAGRMNTQIAMLLGVDESTVREDLKRVAELWQEQIKAQQAVLRAGIVAELNDTRHRAIKAAEDDAFYERAVLFDDPKRPDYEMERLGLTAPDYVTADGDPLRVSRDEKGAASFRGQKAAALNVARQATMDKAKVLGLIVDKVNVSGDLQREAEKVAQELGLDPESTAKVIDFAKRKKAS